MLDEAANKLKVPTSRRARMMDDGFRGEQLPFAGGRGNDDLKKKPLVFRRRGQTFIEVHPSVRPIIRSVASRRGFQSSRVESVVQVNQKKQNTHSSSVVVLLKFNIEIRKQKSK
jgi:hypothetical protein